MSNTFDNQDNIPAQSEGTRTAHRNAADPADGAGHGPGAADSGRGRSYHFFGSGPNAPVYVCRDGEHPQWLLTVADTACALNVSVRTVRELIADGDLASVKIRRNRRIEWRALQSYIERQARAAAAAHPADERA
ncbi:helix-turn-helix domain-containing protein [Streptomonospora sp. S1-112]|uniref:Helix-turn-helix domain-containing protein n=1 Tax=Streptomonospora mangrovi TaxID=2883123 RepID=A0A9X3NHG6_9ACTN|nr:helix-turn-helix domain-containing protein [Streptomonospora mangrovi]MDA0563582.1 helix-turn-helix domain-containing protein [Streptomonospora mangrovi]